MRKLSQIALALALALPALAADVEAEGGSPSLFSGDIGNALWTLAIFLLVLWVLGKYAWGPILTGLQGREEYIKGSLDQARLQREAAEQRLAEYEAKLAAARTETEELLAEARRDAAALREREIKKAESDAAQMLERAKREIAIAKDTAVKDLYTHATALSTKIAGNILEREINPQDHERLIADSIAAIERAEQHN